MTIVSHAAIGFGDNVVSLCMTECQTFGALKRISGGLAHNESNGCPLGGSPSVGC